MRIDIAAQVRITDVFHQFLNLLFRRRRQQAHHNGGQETDGQAEYVAEVRKSLAYQGVRVIADVRNEKVGYKIREHTLQRVPYLLVAGDREREQGLVAVRSRSGEDLGTMTPEAFVARLRAEAAPAA